MPRQPRLDAPGVLHHVMVRGLDRQAIFRGDSDRDDFVGRLARLADVGAITVYAWALLPNHAHLLVRTGGRPLARSMRSLLTGYAGSFNRRHRRTGHLFQNRYKSIVVDEEQYLLELVRYLHLNPLRAKVVPDLRALGSYRWAGHSALMGTVARAWQATSPILERFGQTLRRARHAYGEFVAAGAKLGRRPELQGGGLVRSAGGWAGVARLRRGREAYASDERVLGDTEFVIKLREAVEAAEPVPSRASLDEVVVRVCRAVGIRAETLRGGGRRPANSRAREGIAYLWVEALGHAGRPLGVRLGIRPAAVYKAAARGAAEALAWRALLERGKET